MEKKYYTPARAAGNKRYLAKFKEVKVRMTPEQKEQFVAAAAEKKKSLNQFMIDAAEKEVKKQYYETLIKGKPLNS